MKRNKLNTKNVCKNEKKKWSGSYFEYVIENTNYVYLNFIFGTYVCYLLYG